MRDDYKVGFWILIFKNLFSIYFLMKMTNKQPKIYWERRESAFSGITKDHFILDVFYNCIISAYNRIVKEHYVLDVWYELSGSQYAASLSFIFIKNLGLYAGSIHG